METSIILISLIFSAFFSGMEIAFISMDKLQLEVEKRQNKLSAKLLSYFVQKPDNYIGTMLVGNNIALVIYGLFMAALLEPKISQYTSNEALILILQTVISTLIILFFAEFLPKAIFRTNPNKILKIFSPFIIIFYYLFYPVTVFTIFISNFFINKILKSKDDQKSKQAVFGRADLKHFLEQFRRKKEIEEEIKIISKTLNFDKIKVKECMVPRNEIVALPVDSTIEDLVKKMSETGLSKIVIYKDSIDNVLGYVHSIELYKDPQSIEEIIVEMPIVPETMSAKKLYNILIENGKSLALVVDEYGGTSGIVSIEDILEEIFGDIQDEHDVKELTEKKISDNEFIFSARLEIDYLNDKYKLDLPKSSEYETLAGLILDKLERYPQKGEKISIKNFTFEILEIEKARIKLVKIIKNEDKK